VTDDVVKTNQNLKTSQDFFERIMVPFDDIDAGGVLYNAHYLKYCDRARNRIWSDLGWGWDRLVQSKCVLAVVGVQAEYRRAVRQGPLWIVSRFSSESERVLNASHVFLPGEWSIEVARQKVADHKGPLESMRGVHFRSAFKLVPIAAGDMIPATMDRALIAAIFADGKDSL
jgi:YbgC/YbaW family acyl-CoA thioester hydrolase